MKLPRNIRGRNLIEQEFDSKIGVGFKEYCAKCGRHINPEGFSSMSCRHCGSIKLSDIYAIAENGLEGSRFKEIEQK